MEYDDEARECSKFMEGYSKRPPILYRPDNHHYASHVIDGDVYNTNHRTWS
jgi:hypothetical protein